MHFKSLTNRIAVTFLTLILVVQFLGFTAIRISINENARTSLNKQLEVGEQVFHNSLTQISDNLSQTARVLAEDYGFRQAIGSEDSETIASALDNHRHRVKASLAMYYTADGVQRQAVGELPLHTEEATINELVKVAQAAGSNNDLAIIGNRPYQIVVQPIKAPLIIGWIVMGFAIDDNVAELLAKTVGLQVTFLTKLGNDGWHSSASTLPKAGLDELEKHIPGMLPQSGNIEIELDGVAYHSRIVKVHKSNQQSMIAVLQSSLDDAIAPYQSLQLNLLILTLLGALVFILGSIWTARKIITPLTKLVDSTENLQRGDYSVAITTDRQDEIGNLSRALDLMREGIATREQKISRLAYSDELTQLPNRAGFLAQLEQALIHTIRNQMPLSVMMLDLDRFKQINDVLGQAAANSLLQGVAERLRAVCRSERGDIVARMGGDEFAIYLPNTDSATAHATALRITKSMEQPIVINEQFVDLSAGIGIASFPEHADQGDLLISRAEIAMYAAKAAQAGCIVYDSHLDPSNQQNLSLASELKHAIEKNELRLYVQPKVDMSSGKVTAAEALIRWMHPERGLIPPDTFIPFAEQTGLVRKISLWMFDEAARYTLKWQQHGLHVVLAVNLSARDLIDQDLPNKLALTLYKYNLQPSAISLEITESAIMDDPMRAQMTVERLSKMGIRLAIDDFGIGFSSLAYLKNLPVDELKIDKSFVLNMENDADDRKIVRSTIDLGHNLGLKVVAEGVENQKVWDLLAQMGCDYAQGYHMSRPIPADEFPAWVDKWSDDRAGGLEARAGIEPA